MKTNASIKSVVAAVEKVSDEFYGGNLILAKKPEYLTKNVLRFTLRTQDKFKAGSLKNKDGKLLPRADWDAHMAVINEIFNIEGKRNIYVDTMYGREYCKIEKPSTSADSQQTSTPVHESEASRTKRKYTKRKEKSGLRSLDRKAVKRLIGKLREVLETEMV